MTIEQLTQLVMLISAVLGIFTVLAGIANAFAPLWGPFLPRLAAIVGGLGMHVAQARQDLAEVQKILDDAKKATAPRPPPLPLFILMGLLTGCATARDVAVLSLAQASEFGTDAEHGLELLDRADQEDAIAHAADPRAAVLEVRRKYAAAWRGYRKFRAAWIAAAGSVRVYDDAERLHLAHTEAEFTSALVALLDAERELVKATTALRGAK